MAEDHRYHQQLKAFWEKACDLYAQGNREPGSFFEEEEKEWIGSIGATVMDFYDFAEDYQRGGEPDWETFLLIQSARRDYFLEVQEGKWSAGRLEEENLPAKTDSVEGVEWLPRLIEKARAKLRGELTPTIMFCCGGDRNFFQTHAIHPADFLRAAWAYEDDDGALVEWTLRRSHARGAQAEGKSG